MNTDIYNLNKYRKAQALLLFVTVFSVMNLAGCGGGMEGTGTGPTTDIYQLKRLPKRISPDIPKTLLRGEEIQPSSPENQNAIENNNKPVLRMDEIGLVKSDDWIEMTYAIGNASSTRVDAEINSTIIDIAFDDIRSLCVDNLINCTIPADQIKVKLTQNVINRFIEITTNWVESLPREFLINELGINFDNAVVVIKEQMTSLLDTEVVLGVTHYSQLDGAPYNHSVQTVLSGESTSEEEFAVLSWDGQEFYARWHEDGNVAKFIMDDVGLPIREYFYQNNTPSELVIASIVHTDDDIPWTDTHIRLIANDRNRAGVLVEFAEVGPLPLGFDIELDGSLANSLTQGQIDNGGGFVTVDAVIYDIADTPLAVYYLGRRQSFDNVGNLIAATACEVRDLVQGIQICNEEDFLPTGPTGSTLTESPYYFQAGNFDSLTATHDVIRWAVEGIPSDIKHVAVVSADSTIELSERELLCRGFQTVSDDRRVFCATTDEQLESTLVLELIDGRPGDIIPTANLVQVQ